MISRRAEDPSSDQLNIGGDPYRQLYRILWDINENIKFLLGADKIEKKSEDAEYAKLYRLIKEGWTLWEPSCELKEPDLPKGTEVIFMTKGGLISSPRFVESIWWWWGENEGDLEYHIIAYRIVNKEKADD